MYENLPSWLNLLVLVGLAIITWWYAYSTREMARIMKETYETETAPQLACTVKDLATKIPKKGRKKISFTLMIENAGSVEIPCVPADESAGSADASVLKHAPPARFSGLSLAEPDASAPGSVGFLQSHYQDFKGRSHSQELSIPKELMA